jgi:hypothetical protein
MRGLIDFSVRDWRLLGVDRAILFSILGTARSMVGGPLIALLITLHFTPVVQGFYYTFSSVLALQVFAELGLGTVLLQFASHEWAGIERTATGIVGQPENLSRLSDLLRLALRWYGSAAIVSAGGLMVGGYLFFHRQGHAEVGWVAPWMCLCALTGLKLFFTPFFSLLEGCGQLKEVYGYRLAEGFLTMAVAVVAIVSGGGLWTAVAVTGAALLGNVAFLGWRHGAFFRALRAVEITARLSWRQEMLPMQWRIAASWACGYFVFQLFTPVLFNYQGAIVAGQFGLAWALVNAVSNVSTAWINTKVPQFGALIARREFAQLDQLAWRAALGAVAVAAFGALAALAGLRGLEIWFPAVSKRFLPLTPCALLLVAVVLMQFSYAQSTYLRAHKREPFLGLSVFGAVLMSLSTWYFGSRFGAAEMAWGYLGVVAFFTLPVGTAVFLSCRRKWHAPPT